MEDEIELVAMQWVGFVDAKKEKKLEFILHEIRYI